MTENDPGRLADAREREADQLEERSEQLAGEVKDVRADWHHKRADDDIAGAPPLDNDLSEDKGQAEGTQDASPAPEAPPASEGPSQSNMASEGAAGPPNDTEDQEEG